MSHYEFCTMALLEINAYNEINVYNNAVVWVNVLLSTILALPLQLDDVIFKNDDRLRNTVKL